MYHAALTSKRRVCCYRRENRIQKSGPKVHQILALPVSTKSMRQSIVCSPQGQLRGPSIHGSRLAEWPASNPASKRRVDIQHRHWPVTRQSCISSKDGSHLPPLEFARASQSLLTHPVVGLCDPKLDTSSSLLIGSKHCSWPDAVALSDGDGLSRLPITAFSPSHAPATRPFRVTAASSSRCAACDATQ